MSGSRKRRGLSVVQLAIVGLLSAAVAACGGSSNAGDNLGAQDKEVADAAHALQQWLDASEQGFDNASAVATFCAVSSDELKSRLGSGEACESGASNGSMNYFWDSGDKPDWQHARKLKVTPTTVSLYGGGQDVQIALVDEQHGKVTGFVEFRGADSPSAENDDIAAGVQRLADDPRKPVAIVGRLLVPAAQGDQEAVCSLLNDDAWVARELFDGIGIDDYLEDVHPDPDAVVSKGCKATIELGVKAARAMRHEDARGILGEPPQVLDVGSPETVVTIPVDNAKRDANDERDEQLRSAYRVVKRNGTWLVLGHTMVAR